MQSKTKFELKFHCKFQKLSHVNFNFYFVLQLRIWEGNRNLKFDSEIVISKTNSTFFLETKK